MTDYKPKTPPPEFTTQNDPTVFQSPVQTPPTTTSTPLTPFDPSSIRGYEQGQSPSPQYSEYKVDTTPVPVFANTPARRVSTDERNTFSADERNSPHGQAPERVLSHESSRYLSATPLKSLSREPEPVDCPICGRRNLTETVAMSGNFTHLVGGLACCMFCLGCIPYFINSLKDVKHKCGSCGAILAVWHRSGGGVDVLAHPTK